MTRSDAVQPPRIPDNEKERLDELWALKILDTPPSERLDRVTRIATACFDVPIALVSLVDQHRQWFKSRQGLEATETSRAISLCGHAVADDRSLVVCDASLDARFADNPLVMGAPNVRFYAGQVIHGPRGLPIGTLCIIDRKAREFSAQSLTVLGDLATLVEQELQASALASEWLELRERSRFFEDLAQNVGELVQSVGPKGEILYVNAMWRRTLEYSGLAAPANVFDVIAPDERAHCRTLFEQIMAGTDAGRVETAFQTRTGRLVPVIGSVTRQVDGAQVHTRGVFRDARPDVELRGALRSLGEEDPLTGLPNRRVLGQRLDALVALAVRTGHPLTVAFLDLDRFKSINDTYGHATGDLVLQRFGRVLSTRTRSSDVVARYGGEEFCVVLPDTAEAPALELVESLRTSFLEAAQEPPSLPPTSFSAGLASLGANRATSEALLKAADEAMYRAKASGRNRTVVA